MKRVKRNEHNQARKKHRGKSKEERAETDNQ